LQINLKRRLPSGGLLLLYIYFIFCNTFSFPRIIYHITNEKNLRFFLTLGGEYSMPESRGCGCGGFGGGNDCCWIIILLIIIFCCCGNNNGCGNC